MLFKKKTTAQLRVEERSLNKKIMAEQARFNLKKRLQQKKQRYKDLRHYDRNERIKKIIQGGKNIIDTGRKIGEGFGEYTANIDFGLEDYGSRKRKKKKGGSGGIDFDIGF